MGEVLRLFAGAGRVLDGTLGGGGHAYALLHADENVRVVGLDRDPEAIAVSSARLDAFARDGRFVAYERNYAEIDSRGDRDLVGSGFDGVLLDLGVSSHQVDAHERGFTFRPGAPLEMRMGPDVANNAAGWLATVGEREMEEAFREYADEPRARRLAREIVRRRRNRPMATSDDLVGAIRAALGPRSGPGDFARLFQAVRIVINDEIGGLRRALPALRRCLRPDGTFVVIAYHSGEDRLVKGAFREWSAACICPPKQPVCTCRGRPLGALLTRKAITATAEEVTLNPRARSAHLRAWRNAQHP